MKRTFDIICSGSALILLSPLLLIIAILVRISSPGPVIFSQRRIGVGDKEFIMYKFRTMFVGTPEVATDELTNCCQYITKIGHHLRKYSLDELPQFLNVLRGDMSVVGPRPALYNQYELRQIRAKKGIAKIRPGLTGWAQINGRDEIPLEQKVACDQYYLENRSFLLDLNIILRTISSVYAGNGESARKT